MSKNTTQKSWAFGAGLSLVATAVTGIPAQAAGIGGDFVTLTPTFGDAYAVLLDDTFDLQANFASGIKVSGQDVKFLVTDTNSALRADVTPGQAITSAATIAASTASSSGGKVVVTVKANATDASGQAFTGGLIPAAGDVVKITGLAPASLNGTFKVASAAAAVANTSSANFTYEVESSTDITVSDSEPSAIIGYDLASYAALAANATALGSTSIVAAADGEVSTRATNGSFVVNSLNDSNTNATLLRLAVADNVSTSQTVTVTAWVDSNDDGDIDSTEYVSATRTIKFMKYGDVTAQATLLAPKVGDTALTAEVVTTPVLNGAQVANTNFVQAIFTRQDSEQKAISTGAATQDEDGVWTASVATSTAANTIVRWADKDTAVNASANATWGFTASVANGDGDGTSTTNRVATIDEISVTAAKVATITTSAAHGLVTGDKVAVTVHGDDSTVEAAEETTAVAITVTGTTTFTYALSDTGTVTAATDGTLVDGTLFTVDTYTAGGGDSVTDRVFAGTYSATAALETTTSLKFATSGTASTLGTVAPTAAEVVISGVASASVEGATIKTNDASEDIKVKTGSLTAGVLLTVVDKDGAAVSAGRPVVISFANRTSTVAVNAKKVTFTEYTNASGQIALTVTDTLGLVGTRVDITATAEGVGTATSTAKVIWEDQAYGLYDLNTTGGTLSSETRTVVKGGSYTLGLLLADQWFQTPAAGTYRLKVTGSGATSGIIELSAGKADVKITDTLGENFTTVVTLQKATAGVFADTATAITFTTNVTTAAAAIKIDADGASLYGTSAADLSDKVAAKALVEFDARTSTTVRPAYANDVVINAQVVSSTSSAALNGALVTVSGSNSLLFSNGNIDRRGSITLKADTSGKFTVTVYSTTAATDAVVTIASAGATNTVKVTFTGIGVGEGTALVLTTPEAVKPASTFQVKAQLNDAFGNGVAASTAGLMKVTYTGPGIVFGSLPDKTDATGGLSFSVLLGSNDSDDIKVTVQYDQNGDGDFVDTKDLTTTKTIKISASGTVSAGKVNVGSFNGKLVVYAAGLNGATISWKVGGTWGKQVATSNYAVFNRPTPRAGVTVSVDIYVNGVKTLTKSVVTR